MFTVVLVTIQKKKCPSMGSRQKKYGIYIYNETPFNLKKKILLLLIM